MRISVKKEWYGDSALIKYRGKGDIDAMPLLLRMTNELKSDVQAPNDIQLNWCTSLVERDTMGRPIFPRPGTAEFISLR